MSGKIDDVKLRIYIYLLESGEPKSVREIATALKMPHSSVHYHLKKMVEAGILKKASRGYVIKEKIPLEGYFILRRKVIPRLIVYSLFFLGVFLGELYVISIDKRVFPDRLLVLITSITAFILMFHEGLNALRKLRI